MGSNSLILFKSLAAIPNPTGVSSRVYTTTPAYWGTFSVALATCALTIWLPYTYDYSPDGLTHTLWSAYLDT